MFHVEHFRTKPLPNCSTWNNLGESSAHCSTWNNSSARDQGETLDGHLRAVARVKGSGAKHDGYVIESKLFSFRRDGKVERLLHRSPVVGDDQRLARGQGHFA